MLGTILSWLVGGGIRAIGSEINQWQETRLNARNDADRIAADTRLSELNAQRAIILAAQRDKVERWVRVGFALPFIVYNAKLVIWDKVMGLGSTDPLSPELVQIQTVVLGGYFLLFVSKAIRK